MRWRKWSNVCCDFLLGLSLRRRAFALVMVVLDTDVESSGPSLIVPSLEVRSIVRAR